MNFNQVKKDLIFGNDTISGIMRIFPILVEIMGFPGTLLRNFRGFVGIFDKSWQDFCGIIFLMILE